MQTHEQFYRRHGVRYVANMINPPVYTATDIDYPDNAMIFWPSGGMARYYPSKEDALLTHVNKPVVFMLSEYRTNIIEGDPHKLGDHTSKYLREAKKAEPSFTYPHKKKLTLPKNREVIFSAGVLNAGYRYHSHPLTAYHAWGNSLGTIINSVASGVTGGVRHKYIIYRLPPSIPPRNEILHALKSFTRNRLELFPTEAYFGLLELFKFIHVDYKDKSIIAANLPPQDLKNVDLLLTINGKVSIINLGILASITDAHINTSHLKKYPSDTAFKILYVYLNRVLEDSPVEIGVSAEDVVQRVAETSETSLGSDDKGLVDINDVIDNEMGNLDQSTDDDLGDIDSIATNIDSDVSDNSDPVDLSTVDKSPDTQDTTKLVSRIESLKSDKILTKTVTDGMIKSLKEQESAPSPYGDGSKLVDALKYDHEDMVTDKKSSEVRRTPTMLDGSGAYNVNRSINDYYRTKVMRKDVLNTIYSIQRAGMVIKEHDVEVNKDVLSHTETHKLNIQMLDGSRSVVHLQIPVVNEDNTIRLSGSTYSMRKQRSDIPVKKISNNRASLNSYFGKLFISKATFKKDDKGYWFQRQLLKMYSDGAGVRDVTLVPVLSPDSNIPRDLGLIGRYVKGFGYKGISFNFEYANRFAGLDEPTHSKLEKSGSVIIGRKGKVPVLMKSDNTIYIADGKNTSIGTVFEFLGMDTSKSPMEYCNAKVYKEQIPVCVLLSYYIGFDNLIKHLKIKHRVVESSRTVVDPAKEYKITFLDTTYVITKDHGVGDLIMGGFNSIKKQLKTINKGVLNARGRFGALFTAMGLPILYVNEVKLMEDMFIDPMTKQVLELYKLPTSFTGLLIKAVEILEDDNYKHPNDLSGSMIRGYERISGMMYLELVKAIRLHANRSHFAKSKITVNPYAVNTLVTADSSTTTVDDLNPLAGVKQMEDVTYLGAHGRKEETMSESTRIMHKSEIGVISEGAKDSGAVGISAYLTASPNISNVRGTVEEPKPGDGWGSRLSTAGMLAPFGTKDDVKRLNFSGIQASHVIPTSSMHAPYVLTGYESMIAIKASDKFAVTAKEDGKVTGVSKEEIVVKYKSGKVTRYSIREWTTKEESGSAYTHSMVAKLRKGDSFKEDDVIAYNPSFFEPDFFDDTRVNYMQGTTATVALLEVPETYEDSGSMSAEFAKTMGTVVTKVKVIRVTKTDGVYKPVHVGDKVTPDDPLLSIVDAELSEISNLDEQAMAALQNLKMLSPKAGYSGTVSKLRVFYNCELKDLSPSLRRLVNESNKELMVETGSNGQVTRGMNVNGRPVLEDEIIIKYYIKTSDSMGTGDKCVFGNQLKFTVGEVYQDEVTAEDGTVVDALFSSTSIENRIVNSPGLLGTTSKLLELATSEAVRLYRNAKK